MAKLREVKNRIKAVANIQRITKTMQMIATAKFQAAVRRTQGTQPFTEKIGEIAGELAAAGGDIEHPLMTAPTPETGRELLLVVTSNRGLCGAYNANVLRTASQYIRSSTKNVDLEVVGKKGTAFFKFAGHTIGKNYTQFTDKPTYEEIEEIAADYIERFESGQYDAVKVLYMQFISNAKQSPRTLQIMPMQPPQAAEHSAKGMQAVYEFSPDPKTLLAKLLPLTIKSQLFQAINDAIVSEQIARMIAMKSATDNAGKMRKNLSRQFNRARQAQITTELTEIIGGAAALE